ncbi:MAG: Type 1 glutamine amidotransferase-like domain-containing protein [Lachnospiraceae bacterium]|nr:Type 1 glutamine amidotransferase-like domain-containing protein [Lachnospiraceae bacterium]
MRKELLALFSGFPDHHFSEEITNRLREELTVRKSIVFITACPLDYEKNDDDSDGMHEMFAEQGLGFENHSVIDKRTEPSEAKALVENADCIFLMGGGACEDQLNLIREKGCYEALLDCHAAIFGVSAGSMNMARNTVDFFDSMEPFPGLGFTNITVSCHHDPEDTWRFEKTLEMSESRKVYAMEDMSALFIKNGKIDIVGSIHCAEDRKIRPITEADIKELEQDEFRRIFDTIPDEFDKFRPRYSKELFCFLNDRAGVGPGKRVLEIGPGTGQATDPVLETGCEYHAIELGEHLYRKMLEKYGKLPNFNIVNDDFITHDFGDMKFDMIYSAATIQWIPEEIAFAKTFELLKPGGTLAMMLTSSEYRSDNEALYEKIQALYDKFYKPEIPYKRGKFNYTAAPDYGFSEVERFEFKGRRVFDSEEYVRFSGTHCDHMVIPETLRSEFFEGLRNAVLEAGDRIVFNDTYVLYLTKKRQIRRYPIEADH